MAVPPGVVTTTLFAPAAPAGVTAVMTVEETTTTLVAVTPPTVTVDAPERFVPVIVIAVPPNVDPDVGETEDTVGAGGGTTSLAMRKPMVELVLPGRALLRAEERTRFVASEWYS